MLVLAYYKMPFRFSNVNIVADVARVDVALVDGIWELILEPKSIF